MPGLRLPPIASPINDFGRAGRINVGGVDEIDAGVGDEVDQPPDFLERDIADFGEAALPAKGHRAHR